MRYKAKETWTIIEDNANRVSVTDARAKLSEIVALAQYGRQMTILQYYGNDVAVVLSMDQWKQLIEEHKD